MAAKQTTKRSSTTSRTKTGNSKGTSQNSRRGNSTNTRSRSSSPRIKNDNSKTPSTKEMNAKKAAFHDELILVITLVISILLILSNFNMSGKVGELIHYFTFGLFGSISYVLPFLLFFGIAFYISNRGNTVAKHKIICAIILSCILMSLIQMIGFDYEKEYNILDFYRMSAEGKKGGGVIGGVICKLLVPLFDIVGTYVVLIAGFIVCTMVFTGKAIVTYLSKRGEQSLVHMKEKYRESMHQREMELEFEEGDSEEGIAPSHSKGLLGANGKRRARIVDLKKKPYEIDPATGEILEGKKKNNKENQTPYVSNEVDMSEITPSDITITGSYAEGEEPFGTTYQEELKNKFSSSTDPEMDKSFDHMSEMLGSQITNIMEENNSSNTEGEVEEDTLSNSHVRNEVTGTSPETGTSREMKDHQVKSLEKADTNETNQLMDEIDASITAEKKEEKPYVFPSLDLLSKPKGNQKGMTEKDLKETAVKLQKTLESFGVRVTITNISCGPAVTRYEVQPEQGVKVSKITGLADDIKLNLAAADVRIEAPIPGKAAVGIEVPNKENTAVMFRELIENKEFISHPSDIAFAVGKDIGGQTVVTDIAKMPHLLIAGATGSGKSVCINTLIMSILYKAHPNDVKLIMVDPKVVELSVYNGIPHLMIPVVTDPKKASAALNWAVMEMTERYKKFADLGVRDLKGYNEKVKQVEYLNDDKYQKMAQIVIIVDELADLMMVAPGEVEDAICRLAQMARAAGLHLIIATQRPSVNVITGLIKANVPSRIAFSVSSAIDSRTIIDGAGAEKLLGKGDMLFFPQGIPKPVRIQGAFISDKEVGAVVEFLSSQNHKPSYNDEVTSQITSATSLDGGSPGGSDRDDYFIQAGKFIIEKDKASIGMLQRVYKIGFNRAARIMDQLAEAGVVGPEEGTKPRKVIMSMEEFEQYVDEYV